MKTCSVCQRNYEDSVASCVENHGFLIQVRANSPDTIGGYRLESLLERGAAGDVYQASYESLAQPFAIRIINASVAGAAKNHSEPLHDEARRAAGIVHPNVAQTYESGWLDNGDFYVVSEAVGGRTLREHLQEFGTLSESEAVTIAKQTAEALEAAHRVAVIHRAVNPSNIILKPGEENRRSIKLQNFDFGALQQEIAVDDISRVQPSVVALQYLSPEQRARETVDARTDVFSLGVLLYEMLCGRPPFDAPVSSLLADRQFDEKSLDHLRYDVRALLAYLLKQSLQTSGAARLPSAANFARQLRQVEQLVAPPVGMRRAMPQPFEAKKDVTETAAFAAEMFASPINASLENQPVQPGAVQKDADSLTMLPLHLPIPIEENEESTVGADNLSGELPPVFSEQKAHDFEQNDAEVLAAEPLLIERKESSAAMFDASPILVKKKSTETVPTEFAPVIVEARLESESLANENAAAIETPAAKSNDFQTVVVKKEREAQSSAPIFSQLNARGADSPCAFPAKRHRMLGAAALLALLAAVGLGIFLYNQRNQPLETEQAEVNETAITPATEKSRESSGTSGDAVTINEPAETTETAKSSPIESQKPPSTVSQRETQNQPRRETVAGADGELPPSAPIASQPTRENPATIDTQDDSELAENSAGSERTRLNSSLDQWISATNNRDVERQMNYYAPKVNAYYRARNVSPDLVRAEKKRIFERADTVDIQTDKPEITLSRDGQNATMRFRKKYAIKEGQKNRRGTVIQELQWVKSGGDWKIVSERDVKVIDR